MGDMGELTAGRKFHRKVAGLRTGMPAVGSHAFFGNPFHGPTVARGMEGTGAGPFENHLLVGGPQEVDFLAPNRYTSPNRSPRSTSPKSGSIDRGMYTLDPWVGFPLALGFLLKKRFRGTGLSRRNCGG
jgi:hypothetical protein